MVGSGVVRCLNDRGYTNLILVDDLKQSEKWRNLVGKQFLDLVSRHQIQSSLSPDIDAIIHLGACSDTEETNGDYLLENNTRFSIRLAEWAFAHQKRFIYASSAATYGDGSLGFSDAEEELHHLRPLNLYAFSKHLFDLWMVRQGGFRRAVGLKYFNVFGPNEYHKGRMASLICKTVKKAHTEGYLELYKQGEQSRDFIYLKDAARITCDFLEHSTTGIFNIGSGEATTWNQLAITLFQALGKSPDIRYIEMPSHLVKRYQSYTCAEMRKLWNLIPMRVTPFTEAVSDYVQNYLIKDAQW